jgi:sugar transferase (PEP-CTERM system associated)
MIRLLNVYHPSRTLQLVGYEAAIIALSFVAAFMFRWDPESYAILTGGAGLVQLFVITGTYLICLYYLDTYDIRTIGNRSELIWRLLWVLGTASVILAGIEYFFPNLIVLRGSFVLAIVISSALLLTGRVAFSKVLGNPGERMILVGLSDFGCTLAREIRLRTDVGINLLGYLDDGLKPETCPPSLPRLGSTSDLEEVVRKARVSTVIVASKDRRGRLPVNELLRLRVSGTRVFEVGELCEQIVGMIAVENVLPSWLIFSDGFRLRRRLVLFQRFYSFILAALGLLIMLPAMVLVALAIKLDSDGPVFYSQERVGKGGRTFRVHKFRSMKRDAESASGPTWAVDKDPRVTRVGGFLRVTHLDELPQLWNVLKGEMNLVGPRPERPSFVKLLEAASPFYQFRHLVRPGVTGWQQVCQGYCSSVEEQLDRMRYDLFYIKNISLSIDLFILFKTGKIMIWGHGAK